MLLISDVHAQIDKYLNIVNSTTKNTIQMGDFGMKKANDYAIKNMDTDRNKVNFGNHDYYPYLLKKHSLRNFSLINDKIMTIRGAYSPDRYRRFEGFDWFSNEEMNNNEMTEAVIFYEKHKPKIVVSHDCPSNIRKEYFGYESTITSQGMQIMLNIHKPALWVFGHYHKHLDIKVDGTNFICLEELKTIDIS